MKLTASQVWRSGAAMDMISQRQMPSRVAYEISRVYKLIKAELLTLSEQARPLVSRHGGTIDESGRLNWPKGSDEAAYHREFADLLKAELDLAVTPLKLWQVENMDLSPAIFVDLDWLFVEEPKPEAPAKPEQGR